MSETTEDRKLGRKFLGFVIGATNSGKSTFLHDVADCWKDKVGLVEVGKTLRAKYGASYFNGQAAPEKTAAEAWQLMLDGIEAHDQAGKEIILVDGQPRSEQQCLDILKQYVLPVYEKDRLKLPKYDARILHLYAPESVRLERAKKRDGEDPEKLALSLARMKGDTVGLYNVISLVMRAGAGRSIVTYDTSEPEYRPVIVFDLLMQMVSSGVF
jgi:hypothetical protein